MSYENVNVSVSLDNMAKLCAVIAALRSRVEKLEKVREAANNCTSVARSDSSGYSSYVDDAVLALDAALAECGE